MPTKEKSAPPRAVAAKPARKIATPKAAAAKPVAAKVAASPAPAMKGPVAVKAATAPKTAAPAKAAAPEIAPAPASVVVAAAPTAVKVEAPRPAAAKPTAAPLVIPGAQALPKVLTDVATTNAAQARDAFAVARKSTEAFAAGFGSGGEAAAKGMKSFQAALMEAIQANTDATLGYWRSLAEVKTLSDAIELQAHTARMQFEAFSAQAKTLAGIASRTAQDTAAPVRKALDGTLRHGS